MRLSFTAVSLARAATRQPARLALVFALGLTVAGCGRGDVRAVEEPAEQEAAGVAESTTMPDTGSVAVDTPATEPVEAGGAEVVTLRGLTAGDRACYVEFDDARGQRRTEPGDFPLCERMERVGQRVRLTREPTPIAAESCQGDPECAQQETVQLIVAAEPVP